MRYLFLILAALFSGILVPGFAAETVYTSRDDVPQAYKWNLEVFYPSWEAWETDLVRVEELYDRLAGYRGRLAEGAGTLLEAMRLSDEAGLLARRLYHFAAQTQDLDTRDNAVQARFGKLMGVFSRIGPKLAWVDPEILTIPEATLTEWIAAEPQLEPYRFGLLDTYRKARHILSEEGERLLALHRPVRSTAGDIFEALTDTDGDRPEVTLADGGKITVTAGLYAAALTDNPVAADRRAIQQAWMGQFQQRRNTFAAIYNGVLQQGWAQAQARGYPSTLAMELDADNVPAEVVTTLVAAARAGAVELQRYHRLRQRFLGLDRYGWSDMLVTLVPHDTSYPYDEIVPLVVASVEPLGAEYHAKMAEQFSAGCVDVFETPGKRSGAYNTGHYGVGSFVLLNYHGTLDDFFTVAHEMGHSMHTRLAMEYQPFATHDYTIFVAEVASTLNEKLLLQKLLATVDDPRQRVAFLESQLEGIAGTYFLQVMMADFEMQAHQLVEQGGGITADVLTELWRATVKAYFGDVIPDDDPYMLSWARIPHIYHSPFYVYQYATSYAASSAIMQQMQEEPAATARYLELLKSGGNDYPMNQLRKAGVDLTDPQVVQAVVAEFGRLVDLLEAEYARYLGAPPAQG